MTGTTELLELSGSIDSKAYIKQVLKKLEPDVVELFDTRSPDEMDEEFPFWVLHQDGASCHMSNMTENFLNAQSWIVSFFNRKAWPSNSPDLNPIENIWAIMKSRLGDMNPRNKEQLVACVRQVWAELDGCLIRRLCESVTRRMHLVEESDGDAIKY